MMYFNADTIHQIWLGRNPRPASLMDSWKRKNSLLDSPFVCYESEKHKPGLISNGYLFFPKNHPMMASICDYIETHQVSKASTGLDCWAVTGPKLVTRYLTKDVKILPSWYFIPTHYLDNESSIHEESYSIGIQQGRNS